MQHVHTLPKKRHPCQRLLRPPASSIEPPPPTPSPCPDGYISWYLNCYKLVQEPATWDAALQACRQDTANLASIDTSYEQAFVSGVVVQDTDAWIGLRREVQTLTHAKKKKITTRSNPPSITRKKCSNCAEKRSIQYIQYIQHFQAANPHSFIVDLWLYR